MENNISEKYSHIKGWGIDADPKNDPTYPIKKRTNEEHKGYTWQRPEQQPIDIEILHSNERPNVSAVFGNTLPPKGLSGMIRRFAFGYSENKYRHWLPLLLADRVNVIEGFVDDFSKGIIPNIFYEKGMKADWKFDKPQFAKKVAITAGIVTLAVWLLTKEKKRINS